MPSEFIPAYISDMIRIGINSEIHRLNETMSITSKENVIYFRNEIEKSIQFLEENCPEFSTKRLRSRLVDLDVAIAERTEGVIV